MSINTGDIYETVVEYTRGDSYITVSSTDSNWVKKILKVCATIPKTRGLLHRIKTAAFVSRCPRAISSSLRRKRTTLQPNRE